MVVIVVDDNRLKVRNLPVIIFTTIVFLNVFKSLVAVSFGKVRNLGSLLPHVFRSRIKLIDARDSKSQKTRFFGSEKFGQKVRSSRTIQKQFWYFAKKRLTRGYLKGMTSRKKLFSGKLNSTQRWSPVVKKNSKPSTLRNFFLLRFKALHFFSTKSLKRRFQIDNEAIMTVRFTQKDLLALKKNATKSLHSAKKVSI